jgi:hypothetical protein
LLLLLLLLLLPVDREIEEGANGLELTVVGGFSGEVVVFFLG